MDDRVCEICACGLDEAYENNEAILNMLDIIDATENQIYLFEKENQGVDLEAYFCHDCACNILDFFDIS